MKKISFITLILLLIFLPYIPVQAKVPTHVRVGLERNFKNVSRINISNKNILVNGNAHESSDGFSVRTESDGRFALYSGGNFILTFQATETFNVRDANGGSVSLGNTRFRGALEFGRYGGTGITAVNIVTVDEYLYGVVASEMAAHFHPEALKAQAVAARTYMLTRVAGGTHKSAGYELCDQGHCQAYRGMGNEHEGAVEAVNETHDIIMYHNNEPIIAFFFSSSGGSTDASENVWNESLSYLRPVMEIVPEYEPREWSRTFSWSDLTGALSANNTSIGTANGVEISRTSPTGRVQELTIKGTSGTKVLTKEEIRNFFSSSSGGALDSRNFVIGNTFKPTVSLMITDGQTSKAGSVNEFYGITDGGAVFSMQTATASDGVNTFTYEASEPKPMAAAGGNGVTFSGRGWGHGVGMSQRGAEAMARLDYSFMEILHHYYTGVVIE